MLGSRPFGGVWWVALLVLFALTALLVTAFVSS